MLLRTAKSCGPDAPTLVSSSRSCVGPTGLRQNLSADDGGKRARSPGRARRKPLKPLRAGMPGVPVYSLLLVCVLPLPSAREAAGAAGTRHSPRPQGGERFYAQLGRIAPRDRGVVSGVRATSLRAKRSNPFFLYVARWIASRSLSSGAHWRDPVARNDGSGLNAIQYSEALVIEPKGCGVLDTSLSRGMTVLARSDAHSDSVIPC